MQLRPRPHHSRDEEANSTKGFAFEDMYRSQHDRVYKYFLRRLRDPDGAEELTSETFLKARRGWPPHNQSGVRLLAWLFSIARNLFNDNLRNRWRHPTESLENSDTPDQGSGVGDDLHINRLTVEQAIFDLPPRDRAVIHMRLGGFSNKEIADTLGITEDAASEAILRAVRRLREHVRE